MVVGLVVLGLLIYGGVALWRDFVSTPDGGCYWLLKDDERSRLCLLDAPGDKWCVSDSFAGSHMMGCFKSPGALEAIADFTQKTGRKLCSPSLFVCRSHRAADAGEP